MSAIAPSGTSELSDSVVYFYLHYHIDDLIEIGCIFQHIDVYKYKYIYTHFYYTYIYVYTLLFNIYIYTYIHFYLI